MIAKLKQEQKTLYDRDYYLWLTETVEQLKTRNLTSLDWHNLEECYQYAREIFAKISRISLNNLPVKPIANIEEILDVNWLP